MNDKVKLVFIGAGNMAQAMITGLLKNEKSPFSIGVTDYYIEKCEQFRPFGVQIFDNNIAAAEWADMIVFAIKPQQYETVLSELRHAALADKVYISIAAGISTQSVCRRLGKEVPVIRVMPNTPLLMGMGSTALCANSLVDDNVFAIAETIFSSSGTTMHLPESKMNAVIAATGSAPAYIYLIIKAIYDEAVAQGVPEDGLMENICQMVKGSAEMVLRSEDAPEVLIQKVCSPGGTTERAMQTFYENKLENIIADAMRACTNRAEELGKLY